MRAVASTASDAQSSEGILESPLEEVGVTRKGIGPQLTLLPACWLDALRQARRGAKHESHFALRPVY